jgi:hypothetical protein
MRARIFYGGWLLPTSPVNATWSRPRRIQLNIGRPSLGYSGFHQLPLVSEGLANVERSSSVKQAPCTLLFRQVGRNPHPTGKQRPPRLRGGNFGKGKSHFHSLFNGVILKFGGRGGIRTHGWVTPTPDFESGAFNHSATLPLKNYSDLTSAKSRQITPLLLSALRYFLYGQQVFMAKGLLQTRSKDKGTLEVGQVILRAGGSPK